jgi:hypothetical protein
MKESGGVIWDMAEERWNGLMEQYMMEIGRKIEPMDREHFSMWMEMCMKGIGLIIGARG